MMQEDSSIQPGLFFFDFSLSSVFLLLIYRDSDPFKQSLGVRFLTLVWVVQRSEIFISLFITDWKSWIFCQLFNLLNCMGLELFFLYLQLLLQSSLPISLNLVSFSSFIESLLIRAQLSVSNRFFLDRPGGSTLEDSLEGEAVVMNLVGTNIFDSLTNNQIALSALRNVVQFFRQENSFLVALVS